MVEHNRKPKILSLFALSSLLCATALTISGCQSKAEDGAAPAKDEAKSEAADRSIRCPKTKAGQTQKPSTGCDEDEDDAETSPAEDEDDVSDEPPEDEDDVSDEPPEDEDDVSDEPPEDDDDKNPDPNTHPELSLQDLNSFNIHCDRKAVHIKDIRKGAFGVTGLDMLARAGQHHTFVLDSGNNGSSTAKTTAIPNSVGKKSKIYIKAKPSGDFVHVIPRHRDWHPHRDGCVEQLDLEVIIGFQSEDGAFSEQLEGQLSTFNTKDPEVVYTMAKKGLSTLPFDSWLLTDVESQDLRGKVRFKVHPKKGETCSPNLELNAKAWMSKGKLQHFDLRVQGECRKGEGDAAVSSRFGDEIYRNRR